MAVSIYDLAKACSLSPATVSRALNHPGQVKKETRALVERKAEEMGFKKRRYSLSRDNPGSASSRNFLMLLPTPQNQFYDDIIEGAAAAAVTHNARLFIDYSKITEENVRQYLKDIKEMGFAGAVLLSDLSLSVLEALKAELEFVQCSEYNELFPGISYVSVDNEESEYRAAEYLLSLGCRDIGYLTAPFTYNYAVKRRIGLERALRKRGLACNLLQVPSMSFHLALDAATHLLTSYHTDAVLCTSDLYAAAAVKAAWRLGLSVPGDIQIVGFDNISISETTVPSLTTVAQPRFKLGYTAFNLLLEELSNPGQKKQHVILPTELIIRESTAQKM